MEIKKCLNCGGNNFEEGISIGLSNEPGNVGPVYKANFMVHSVTQLYCDLCLDCGEVGRFYIKDITNRNWIKKPGSFGTK